MSVENMIIKGKERSRMEAIYWAGVLIWAGLVFGAEGLSLLPQIGSADAWTWLFLGAGLYGTGLNVYGSFALDNVTTTWDYIWSGFWLTLGVSGLFTINVFWPLALVLVGGITLVNAFRRS
jgi:hypothetical protein